MKNNDWHSSFGKGREAGRAGILVELKSGLVTVKHSETLEVLFSLFAYSGTWDKIFKSLKKIERENDAEIK